MFPTPWPPNHSNVRHKDKDCVKFFIILFNFLSNYMRLFHHLHECMCCNVSCCTLIRIFFFVLGTLVLNHLIEKKKWDKKDANEQGGNSFLCNYNRKSLEWVAFQSNPQRPGNASSCCTYFIFTELKKLLPMTSLFTISYRPASSTNCG